MHAFHRQPPVQLLTILVRQAAYRQASTSFTCSIAASPSHQSRAVHASSSVAPPRQLPAAQLQLLHNTQQARFKHTASSSSSSSYYAWGAALAMALSAVGLAASDLVPSWGLLPANARELTKYAHSALTHSAQDTSSRHHSDEAVEQAMEAVQKSAAADQKPQAAAKQLPEYTPDDVALHRTAESRIWVTYKDGVYDITDFVASHPGGAQKIMLAGKHLVKKACF